ncbi:MAG: NFACT RNA binding domain-containing protein [Treponema sp.]
MSLNCTEINTILDELALEGYYIQKIVQPSYSIMVLHLYKTRPLALLICLEGGACRLHETRQRIPKFDKPLRFMELLRSRIRGAKIIRAEQLNNDRIVRLVLETSGGRLHLYIRLWSGAANIILTEPAPPDTNSVDLVSYTAERELIIDAFYRRPARNEVSGACWIVPAVHTSAKIYTIRSYNTEVSFNEAIDQWYAQKAPVLSLESLRAEAERFYAVKLEKISLALEKLEHKKQTFLHADQLKHQGDLLLAYSYSIPAGAAFAELEDYAHSGSTVRIALDPHKTAQENAASYYGQYKKAVSGLAALTDDIAALQQQQKQLEEELAAIRTEENPHIIDKLLRKKKIPSQQKQAAQGKERPGLGFYYQEWTLFVGRTAAENDELLRHHVRGKDMWLHVRDYSGGYVFIKNKAGKSIPLPVLIAAGNLAVFYSKARKNEQADLYYTAVKNLRRAKNAPKGTVLPANEKNLSIRLDPAILKELEQSRM